MASWNINEDLKADGSIPLTANWNIGGFALTNVSTLIIGVTATARSPLDVLGSDASGLPVLTLEQLDVSEEMIRFEAAIAVGNPIEGVGLNMLGTTHFIKVLLPGGLVRYLQVGTIIGE